MHRSQGIAVQSDVTCEHLLGHDRVGMYVAAQCQVIPALLPTHPWPSVASKWAVVHRRRVLLAASTGDGGLDFLVVLLHVRSNVHLQCYQPLRGVVLRDGDDNETGDVDLAVVHHVLPSH